jgi:hypothetical protein
MQWSAAAVLERGCYLFIKDTAGRRGFAMKRDAITSGTEPTL